MEIVISIDDGSVYDSKIAGLLSMHELTGTFFIPSNHECNKEVVKKISENHIIGGHTENHALLTRINKEQQIKEIENNKIYLEELIGKTVNSFAYPKGWYNDDTVDSVKQCGFKEAYTMKLGYTEYTGNKLTTPRTFHLRPREEYKKDGLCSSAIKLFDEAKNSDGYFNMCMHGWEIQKFNTWDELQVILQYIHDKS